MKNNPFTSDTFKTIWLKHFQAGASITTFPGFQGIDFVKHPRLPLYYNTGKTLTKGISYFPGTYSKAEKGSVFLIYDVPMYEEDLSQFPKSSKLHRLKQYPGFIVNLNSYRSFTDYFTLVFSRKSRYKLRSYLRTLESECSFYCDNYWGEIHPENYHFLMKTFRQLMLKRFKDKKEFNNNVHTNEWPFYVELFQKLIQEKKASIFVGYHNNRPISININYLSGDTLILAMTVFDTDYIRYNVGTITILKHIEWCFKNKLRYYDFSKGDYSYKKRWGSDQYDFEYHIWYDPNSIKSLFLAHGLTIAFKLKQILRYLGIDKILLRIKFQRLKSVNEVISL